MPLIVFDLDGTLIDSRRDLADAANALVVERGGAALAMDSIAAMVGEGASVLVTRVLTAARIAADLSRDLPRFLELYDARLLAHTRLYDGIAEALTTLATQATLAVLTNKPQRASEEILRGLGAAHFFTSLVGGDTPLGRKPDSAGLLDLCHRHAASPPTTVLVGDSSIDLRTARAAGTRLVLARYGFGFPSTDGLVIPSDAIASAPHDLVRLVTAPS